ncbi:MAG TPA: response regulator transcription factor [Candidatus Cybelea sp.]|nr:response regulator transcription factor [Candidatus Cybelea sp.]
MDESPVSILLVDDFQPFRAAVSLLLRRKAELQIAAEASDGVEAVQKAMRLQPHLILLDIGLPKLDGIRAARQMRAIAPRSRIIFVTQERSSEIVQEAMALGASGYIVKAKVDSELLSAIEVVLEGQRFVGTGVDGQDNPPRASKAARAPVIPLATHSNRID